MNINIFVKLLQLATQKIFVYKSKVYQQYNGVSMDSPLGQTLSNFFLAHVVKKMFERNLEYYSNFI